MKILKFGGTSVGSLKSINKIAEILLDEQSKGHKFLVVNSAMSGITNKLIEIATKASENNENYKTTLEEINHLHLLTINSLISNNNSESEYIKEQIKELEKILYGVYLLKELSPRSLDLILSFGERLASYILSTYLNQKGLETEVLDAREVIVTDNSFGNAKVNSEISNKKISAYFNQKDKIQIVTGFISSTERGATTTLGRGGSDYTASIFAAALEAESVEIWTDVDGVMTADPRAVKEAFSLEKISYEEAMELSHFGAKVIYPPTIQPLLNNQIPIYIKNTFRPDFKGTLITKETDPKNYIKGISNIKNVALINFEGSGLIGISGTSQRLFGALANNKINIILITQASSEHSITFALEPKDAQRAKEVVEEEFQFELSTKKVNPIVIQKNLSVLAIIGENMRKSPGIAGKFFSALGKNGINIVAIAQGSSELNVSAIIPSKDLEKALNVTHESFFLSDHKTIHLFVVGTGLIGTTLLKQIAEQKEELFHNQNLNIKVIGIARSKKMYFNENSIDLNNWEDILIEKGQETKLDTFVDKIKSLNLNNSIFVDNTSNAEVTKLYQRLLSSSVSVTTPNKLASSGDFDYYNNLKTTAQTHGVKYLFETNVGAGLPILNTLNDLKNSGDQVLTIEGVLSGTLSYIFNSYDGSIPYSQVVKQARELGFTEPDPRDDLNGMDVARKILILARESGYVLELEDVKIKSFLPQACFDAPDVDAFFQELEKFDDEMENIRLKASNEGKVLRVIANLEHGKTKLSLQAVDQNNPFYSLSGSDNMIVFKTKRYQERPLVVKGPGAGADVTAAGVFAEIISIANYLS